MTSLSISHYHTMKLTDLPLVGGELPWAWMNDQTMTVSTILVTWYSESSCPDVWVDVDEGWVPVDLRKQPLWILELLWRLCPLWATMNRDALKPMIAAAEKKDPRP